MAMRGPFQAPEPKPTQDQPARGSDDDFCSVYPEDGHSWHSISVDAGLIRWVMRCHLCGRINNRDLREQLRAGVPERYLAELPNG